MDNPSYARSAELFERAKLSLPGGVSRNTLLKGSHPLYATHAEGCYITDVDGIKRLDFANNMAAHIHGHAYPPIVDAVTKQLHKGFAYTMATEVEIAYAEHMVGRSDNFEMIRFVNSGTEAVMAGLKAARAFTGRSKVAKVEGCYHGSYDYAEVSQASNPSNWGEQLNPNAVPLAVGTPKGVAQGTVVLPYNEIAASIALLDANKEDLAVVIIDPIPHRAGMYPVDKAYVDALRKWTRENGSLLMFDEVITMRVGRGGMQEQLDIEPDITSMGKMIGGGFPVGALAGRKDVMEVFTNTGSGIRLPHAGTFSANPITMTAGLVAMQYYDAEDVARLNALGDYTRASLREVIRQADIPASVNGYGSLFRVHLKAQQPRNYRESHVDVKHSDIVHKMIDEMYDQGIMMIHTLSGALSTPMDEAVIDRFSDAMLKSMLKVKPLFDE